MKVVTDMDCGTFSMWPAEERKKDMSDEDWASYSAWIVEVPDDEYARYEQYLDQHQFWFDRIKALNNQGYAQYCSLASGDSK
jgi:hypothetical protein